MSLFCLDQDDALDFSVNVLGFQPRTDISTGEESRWLTVSHLVSAASRGVRT